jgi:hypothetical protein
VNARVAASCSPLSNNRSPSFTAVAASAYDARVVVDDDSSDARVRVAVRTLPARRRRLAPASSIVVVVIVVVVVVVVVPRVAPARPASRDVARARRPARVATTRGALARTRAVDIARDGRRDKARCAADGRRFRLRMGKQCDS